MVGRCDGVVLLFIEFSLDLFISFLFFWIFLLNFLLWTAISCRLLRCRIDCKIGHQVCQFGLDLRLHQLRLLLGFLLSLLLFIPLSLILFSFLLCCDIFFWSLIRLVWDGSILCSRWWLLRLYLVIKLIFTQCFLSINFSLSPILNRLEIFWELNVSILFLIVLFFVKSGQTLLIVACVDHDCVPVDKLENFVEIEKLGSQLKLKDSFTSTLHTARHTVRNMLIWKPQRNCDLWLLLRVA